MLQKIKALEEENLSMLKSFDSQRAKLKELYVQKVRELDEVKTSMVVAEIKAQEEISSLQQLVQGNLELFFIFFIVCKLFVHCRNYRRVE